MILKINSTRGHTGSLLVITKWHYCISVQMVTWWVHWIVNVSNCKSLWIARRKHKHLQPAGQDHSGWVTTERQMDKNSGEKEGGRMQCFMKKEDKSLIDVENGETTSERCSHLS